MPGSSAKK
jgi:hypothetical protein